LYKKKDFPHGLGLTIILLGFAASTVTYWRHELGLTWAILLGTAAFDGLLYLLVKDVVVCYRCNAHYRGVPAGPEHKPFELTIHERYRQERIRREQLQTGYRASGFGSAENDPGLSGPSRVPKPDARHPKPD
jgi:hypothetical protein